jgi:hypothetical protein
LGRRSTVRRSAFAQLADLALEESAGTVDVEEAEARSGLTPAQLLLEAAESVRRGEVRVVSLEVVTK